MDMTMEILGRILHGMGAGLLFGVVPLVLGSLLGKNTGGIIGIFVCMLCGGIFGFLDKSAALIVIVMVIIVLFIVTDKSRPTSAKKSQGTADISNGGSDAVSDNAENGEDAATEDDASNDNQASEINSECGSGNNSENTSGGNDTEIMAE